MSAATDEELVAAIGSGDTDSLGALVLRWEQPLFRFVYRLLLRREDARDVCQETFLRVLKKAHRFDPGSRFSTWMYQIALNLCRDQARRRSRWGRIVADRPPGDANLDSVPVERSKGSDPESQVERGELQTAVLAALQRLPPEQREVLVMKEFEELKFREIAEILGCPESTVKSRMYYGLNGLRVALERDGIRGA